MNIVIDFDGTICEHNFPGMGDPKPGVRDALLRFKKLDSKIYIHSCRTASYWDCRSSRSQKERIEQYLGTHGIPYDEVWMHDKQIAAYYIDDRAIRFEDNWNEIADRIEADKIICKKCGQHNMGQSGTEPCPDCGLPLKWEQE